MLVRLSLDNVVFRHHGTSPMANTPTSRGAELLSAAATDAGSIRKLATNLDQDFSLVSRWISGARVPEYKARKLMMDELGIPLDSWDEPASSQGAA